MPRIICQPPVPIISYTRIYADGATRLALFRHSRFITFFVSTFRITLPQKCAEVPHSLANGAECKRALRRFSCRRQKSYQQRQPTHCAPGYRPAAHIAPNTGHFRPLQLPSPLAQLISWDKVIAAFKMNKYHAIA